MKSNETTCSSVLVSAPQGRSGKTLASLALCTAFRKRGFSVQPFKKGPDYIDPSWLSEASGRSCRNLDPFLMSEETMMTSFRQACRGADSAVIEGAMGLYDGPESSGSGSTAHLARLLNVPVILVINASRMTGSIAAMVSGYQHFQPDVNIAAVILNNVSGGRHEHKLVSAVEEHCSIPVVGRIPRDTDFNMTERHLGLIPFRESANQDPLFERIYNRLIHNLDLDTIIDIASSFKVEPAMNTDASVNERDTVKIGVILDRAFNFYYPENLESLRQMGAELVFIDSFVDRLPDVDGLYIGGGFPEFFLKELVANRILQWDIADSVENGLPVYAECAGLMYLCRRINWQGRWHKMTGIIPADIHISQRPQGHGYVIARVMSDNPFFPVGFTTRGHEFHHSTLYNTDKLEFAYSMERGHGVDGRADGIIYKNVLASYTHLHALGTPQWAESFVSLAFRERKCHRSIMASCN